MAKKIAVEEKPAPKSTKNLSNADIAKTFGDGVVVDGKSILDNPKEVISVSPALDSALGGGFQIGSLVTIAGPPRSGKTTTSLHFAAKWQKTGRKVVYLDAEHRLRDRDLNGIPGLNAADITVIASCRGKILSAQDFLSIAYTYLSQETDTLVIIDSISILSEEREMTGGLGTETRGGAGKIIAQFCRLTTPVIPVNNNMVIGMAHLYANTSGYGKAYVVSMGRKADYALSTSLYSTKVESWNLGTSEDKDVIGQINHWKVERTPLNAPGEIAKSYLRYGSGIDEIQEILKFAEDLSLFEVNGSWYSYPNKAEAVVRGQGMEKFKNALLDNGEAWAELQGKIKELIL